MDGCLVCYVCFEPKLSHSKCHRWILLIGRGREGGREVCVNNYASLIMEALPAETPRAD